MNSICRDIFKAIHEGKWLEIEYKNKSDNVTKYWIAISDINMASKTLSVDAMHLGLYSIDHYPYIYIDSILSSKIIDASYYEPNKKLIYDIQMNPRKYKPIFGNSYNLKILNYLEMCNRMDTTPYFTDYTLVSQLDQDSFNGSFYHLSDEQFKEVVTGLRFNKDKVIRKDGYTSFKQLAMNVVSIHTKDGLYLLAYRRLNLDVAARCFRPSEDITICMEFTIDEKRESIRKFLEADDYELLNDFEKNQEIIKDRLTKDNRRIDDMPYIIGIGNDVILDLHEEYSAIIDMYQNNTITIPLKAFFGDLLERPRRSKAWPIALLNNRINMDQLLAIDNAMKYPLAYIQGPPGTGKTNTILNTIITAYFNDRTVLFSSYNNHPINGVFEKLSSLHYKGKRIPFPVLRIGNNENVYDAIKYIKNLYEYVKDIEVFEATLDKRKEDRKERAKRLSELLKNYDAILDLQDRKDAIKSILDYQNKNGKDFSQEMFSYDLQERQLAEVKEAITKYGTIEEEKALELLDDNQDELFQYLMYSSAKCIKRLNEPKYESFINILYLDNPVEQVTEFNKYMKEEDNVKMLQRVFPIFITTCISAHKIGLPKPMFDMVIIDEASQCNTAISLVPIIRGENLMLVGDPQQLNPVILLDDIDNERLKKRYQISEEYDYKRNSIYKTYLASDSVSDEVLLHNHYRCDPKIITFNNKKYYNNKLAVLTESRNDKPLVYCDVQDDGSDIKNTSASEAKLIAQYAASHRDRKIGIITPFVNQKKMIETELERNGIKNVTCGTVHAFQGDEKDEILFSTAITKRTMKGTYQWLKNNKELINVATSRAKDKLVILGDFKEIERLHTDEEDDDFFELVQYTRTEGTSTVSPKVMNSRALGIKPFSTETEEAFLQTLTHAMGNVLTLNNKYRVQKEVPISQVFVNNEPYLDLFYTGRFDFVIYEKRGNQDLPLLAIELDGKEHCEDEVVMARDSKKDAICKAHNLQLIRVDNTYARRYNHIKEVLIKFFNKK